MSGKYEASKGYPNLTLILCCVLAGMLIVGITVGLLLWAPWKDSVPTEPTSESTVPSTEQPTEPSTEPVTEPPTQPPTEPSIVKEASATISAVGDILPHMPIVRSYNFGEDGYIFDEIFDTFRPYIEAADYAIANLETTLSGADYPDGYIGYPRFNSPDSLADALKNAGFDMLLTSNNHAYDTGHSGFIRTQEYIRDLGFDHLGTRLSADLPRYLVKEINGIRIGMVCYSYEGGARQGDRKVLNMAMSAEDSPLITSFSYADLPGFYAEAARVKAAMEADGADATVFLIHWGDEYHTTQNATQSAIAQQLCDLGVDVIIGGHPHVVQPMELLTSTVDPRHKTVCLYSMGNCLSNQRQEFMDLPTAHTEDGVMMQLTFTKYSDGTVILSQVDLLPTWVHMIYFNGDIRRYTVYPLDPALESWQEAYHLDDYTAQKLQESYDRTMSIVGSGLEEAQDWLARHTAEVEAALGMESNTP